MIRRLFFALTFAAAFIAPAAAPACPLCKEAISATGPDEDPNALPAAYNNSIYLMVSVPYLCLGVVGFLVYRSLHGSGGKVSDQFAATR